MARTTDLSDRFIEFVQRLFELRGFTTAKAKNVGDMSLDLALELNGKRAVVTTKIYGSRHVASAILKNAVQNLNADRQRAHAQRGVLVTTVRVDTLNRAEISKFPLVLVYDYDALSELVGSSPELATELEEIVRHTSSYRQTPYFPFYVDPSKMFDEVQGPDPEATRVIKGRFIRMSLESLAAGEDHAADFEHACIDAITYIFGEDLVSWIDQLRSVDGLHRFDAIARISSGHDFWLSLISDFRTRYVVFEFKNYTDPIGQNQIYSTEKYLYPAAMRGTAVIIARKGANENALRAARGALRETGKLIICLSLDDVYEMLTLRDQGGEVYAPVSRILDTMLMKIER
jgi:Restriction endonuclease